MIKRLVLFAICLAAMQAVQAADVSVFGNWSETVGPGDLVSGPGSDIRSPITSSSYQATLAVANTEGAAWTIRVRRSSSSLPTGVAIAVRRTTSGSGDGGISGGESYLTVNSTEQTLCSGTGDRGAVGLQLRLTGVSVDQGTGSFGATLTYRVY
ncbi:hypothetical protein [Thiococcus pfennigii]|uniref:hypothetical protein n=1 Tax=Thiococcus pfennigii TaxID=1057 RepID=UPI001906ADE6|nr:hypothetical protein [Thiococcus pfennigii]MBK1701749.1 hypothetical protein [Thiococcus pfennigii]